MHFSKEVKQLDVFRTQSNISDDAFWENSNGFGKQVTRGTEKRESVTPVFSLEFCEDFKSSFLRNTSVRLLRDNNTKT